MYPPLLLLAGCKASWATGGQFVCSAPVLPGHFTLTIYLLATGITVTFIPHNTLGLEKDRAATL